MSASEKIDLFKLHKTEYVSPKKPTRVDVSPACYLSVEGDAIPGSEAYQDAIAALYGVAYTVKMTRKKAGLGDFVVCKLEGRYTERAGGGLDKLVEKGKGKACRGVSLVELDGAPCVQMLHLGPYEREPETAALLRGFAEGQGWSTQPLQHDIYLSDPRRAEPEKLRTIVRIPLRT